MRMTIATKITVCIAGVIALAVVSSVVALFSTWHTWELLNRTFQESLTAIIAAEELDIAVLEQRGFVSAYLLDNANRQWLDRLEGRKGNFRKWWDAANSIARTDSEQRILADLGQVYHEYDRKRDEVVRLFDQGERHAAERLLLDDVNRLYDKAYELCESFIEANHEKVDAALERVHSRMRWIIGTATGCVSLTIGLGVALMGLFLRGVVLPLRALVAEARGFAGGDPGDDRGLPRDEMRAVGVYLRNLMSDMADARSTLESSRRELRAAEQLAAVGKLAAGVAHEIRNPLTSLKMWLYSIQKEVNGDEELNRKFGIVSGEVKRLEHVVRHFLEFARPQDPRLQTVSLGSLLDQTFELIQPRTAGCGIRLVRSDAPQLPLICADPEQFKQVLLNVLMNAVDAVGEGGEITVSTQCESSSTATPVVVVVRIRDNGPGMSEAVKRRIFEPFFTTKTGSGTGLGLGISARIMAQHRGRLALESTGPAGTTFAIHVPVAAEA
jgi:signal transduction histidine kinase